MAFRWSILLLIFAAFVGGLVGARWFTSHDATIHRALADDQTPVVAATIVASPAATPTAVPTPLPDRTSCDAIRGSDYRSPAERDWFLANCLPAAEASGLPAIPGPEVQGERWILVDIASQRMSAMIGDRVVYTALVTTGKPGWETPPGTYNIIYRVADETMTSASIGAEEDYVLEHVLYTQYFTTEGHAIHLNYWRDDSYFGSTPSSHGCVGARLADAELFWRFAHVGTRVTIV